jgi:DNA polymerase I-like protein with 3'-5' exonuclease and polymerase domains
VTVPDWLLARERSFAAAFRPAALHGVRLDAEKVAALTAEHTAGRAAARERVAEATHGAVTNPKSAPQVGPYLASTGRYSLPLTGGGKPSAAKGALEPYAYQGDALCADIVEYRRHDTALGLLLDPRSELIRHGDGRVRTSILTLSANTGRTSSRNENLQQVSRQGGMRGCHLAEPGCLIISADFASVEIRVGAALSGDSGMQELIAMGDLHPEKKKEFDFHWRTALTVWGPEATKENRYTAKRINFQKMYGGTPPGCAASVGIPLDLAQEVSAAFEKLAPGYMSWDQSMRKSVRDGTMKAYPTYSGRPVWMTGKGEHAAGNAAIQGTAREFLVDAVAAWEQGPWAGHVIVPVHDEVIVFDVPQDEAQAATAFLVQCMTRELAGVRIIAEANEPSTFWMDAS